MRFILRVFVPTALGAFLVSCGGDDTVSPDQGADEYLGSLPGWREYSPPAADHDEQGNPEPPVIHVGDDGKKYGCITRAASLTRTPEDVVIYSPDSEILYLGSLLEGDGYVGGIGTLQELPIRQRTPLTISIDLLLANNTRVVPNPDLASVNQAIGELIDAATQAGHVAGSSIVFDQRTSHSVRQSALSLGLSARYMGASVSSQLETSQSVETSTLQAYFLHRMFTTSMTLPQTPGELFSEDFTEARLNEQVQLGRIGPDNVPAYVSSITWGRMFVVTMTSTFSESRMRAALNASYDTALYGGEVSAEAREVLQHAETEIKVVTIGGSAAAVQGMLISGNLADYFSQDEPLTSAVPISYTVRSLSDNAIAHVSETVNYEIPVCMGTLYLDDEVEWTAALNQMGATVHRLDSTDDNLNLANEVSLGATGQVGVGPTMTFPAAATGFLTPFQARAPNWTDISAHSAQWSGFVCRDQEVAGGERLISVGDVDNYENDDFELSADPPAGLSVFGLGITIYDNEVEAGENIRVYDEDDVLLDEFIPLGPDRGYRFVGIVSAVPISRFHFDENSGGDDIGVRDFRVGAIAW
jgi:hypothetical protein